MERSILRPHPLHVTLHLHHSQDVLHTLLLIGLMLQFPNAISSSSQTITTGASSSRETSPMIPHPANISNPLFATHENVMFRFPGIVGREPPLRTIVLANLQTTEKQEKDRSATEVSRALQRANSIDRSIQDSPDHTAPTLPRSHQLSLQPLNGHQQCEHWLRFDAIPVRRHNNEAVWKLVSLAQQVQT